MTRIASGSCAGSSASSATGRPCRWCRRNRSGTPLSSSATTPASSARWCGRIRSVSTSSAAGSASSLWPNGSVETFARNPVDWPSRLSATRDIQRRAADPRVERDPRRSAAPPADMKTSYSASPQVRIIAFPVQPGLTPEAPDHRPARPRCRHRAAATSFAPDGLMHRIDQIGVAGRRRSWKSTMKPSAKPLSMPVFRADIGADMHGDAGRSSRSFNATMSAEQLASRSLRPISRRKRTKTQ